MHARARDRADIDDAARGRFELADQPARQHDRREEIDLEHRLPVLQPRAERAEPAAAFAFRRDRRVVDERMQPALLSPEPLLHLDNGADDVVRVGEIDLDVVIGAGLPGTVMRKWVTRAGDHAPASRGEPLHRRVADAARRAGQDQDPPLLLGYMRHGLPGTRYG